MKLNPYLLFEGNAKEALDFYAQALNGKIEDIKTYGDSPQPTKEEHKDKIMHARFTFDDNLIMISDGFEEWRGGFTDSMQLSVDVEEGKNINEVFEKMSEGGEVKMPVQDMFWGARFGMLRDKFGVCWMFNQQSRR